MLLYVLDIILLLLPFIAFHVAIRYLRGDFSFPSFSLPSFKIFKKKDVSEISDYQEDVSETSYYQKDFCELPDNQKDFIQLN